MKKYLIIAFISSCLTYAQAQTISTPRKTTYILPDGKVLPNDKLDSVVKSWGGEFSMRHNEEDDKNGIMHLVKPTAEMKQQQAAAADKRAKLLASMTGQPAPEFELSDINGKKYALASLKGKVVVLNFWFTSCPPCIREMPRLNELVKLYDPEKVVFLALTFNNDQQVNAFLKAHQFDYKLLTNSKKIDEQYQISSWPTSIVINKSGLISMASLGSMDIKKDLGAAIDADL